MGGPTYSLLDTRTPINPHVKLFIYMVISWNISILIEQHSLKEKPNGCFGPVASTKVVFLGDLRVRFLIITIALFYHSNLLLGFFRKLEVIILNKLKVASHPIYGSHYSLGCTVWHVGSQPWESSLLYRKTKSLRKPSFS